MFNPFRRRAAERRASYADAALTAALDAATGKISATADALAVVESCTSLIADPFLVARVSGRPIPPGQLHQMARDLLRRGNSVWALDVVDGELELYRACAWAIEGNSPNPARWQYRLDIATPSALITRILPADSVIHILTDAPAESPWAGRAPWESAGLTARASAELEKSIGDESRLYAGRVWIAPDGASQAQVQAMARTVELLKGGGQVVSETTAQGFGGGASAAPPAAKDWRAEHTGPAHDVGNVQMRGQVEGALSAAYGVSPAYHNVQATAPALAATKRLAYLNKTVPLAALIAAELALKLDSPGYSITWTDLASQSVDVQLRAQAAVRLVEAAQGATPEILELVGLPVAPTTPTPTPTQNDARIPV